LPSAVAAPNGASNPQGVTERRRQATDNGRQNAKVPPPPFAVRQSDGHVFVFRLGDMGFDATPSSPRASEAVWKGRGPVQPAVDHGRCCGTKKPGHAGPGWGNILKEKGASGGHFLDIVTFTLSFRLRLGLALGAARRLGQALLDQLQRFGLGDAVDRGDLTHDPVQGSLVELTL
jgi:hypothetical protein